MTEFKPRFLADYQAPHFKISTIDLTFELDDTATRVINKMQIERLIGESVPLILDGEQLKLISVQIDDKELPAANYLLTDTSLELNIKEKSFELMIVTEINPKDNTSLEGLFKSGDAFCTQCEAEGFRKITYYLDRPDVMAVYSTKVIADKTKYPFMLSNGNKVDSGDLEGNKHFVCWQDPFPKPSYLFALVAGDFDLATDHYVTTSGRKVNLEIFVDKGNLSKADHAMKSLQQSMQWDEEVFGLEYDLDIYMIVAVDFFNMGAMENKGLNVFNSKYVLADDKTATDTDYFNVQAVIAHEYFHNWTGNRVTCRDWFQLSLKEGLTVFRDQQFSADMHSEAVTRIKNVRLLRSQQFAEDAGPMAHPIRPEKVMEMNNFYTLTVYEKGSEVIRMMHTILGADNFRKGMDLYFKRFDGMAVTCDDFVEAMSDASGIDLSQFKRWYSQAGTPLLSVSEHFCSDTNSYQLTIKQSLAPSKEYKSVEALHIPIKIELITGDSNENIKQLIHLTEQQQTWSFDNLTKKPVLALLGGFTSPVKVDFSQSDDDYQAIMVNAEDEFCRWDAGQRLMIAYVKQYMKSPELKLPQQVIDAFRQVLSSKADPALIAEQLTVPSFDEIADLLPEVDPQKLITALKQFKLALASALSTLLFDKYQQTYASEYANDGDSIANRSLNNICLSYLAILPEFHYLVEQHYNKATNMTDALSALTTAAKNQISSFSDFKQSFDQKWHDTTLVMDKWFSVVAIEDSEDIFTKLEELLSRSDFSLKNPNRARALIGSFAQGNPKYFHCSSGRGYQFLASQLKLLNEINPQVASRLITPLIQFKGFALEHQKLMRAELENLAQLPNLSKDLKEKLDAALND